MQREGAAVTYGGRLFHRRAAATENALSPTVDRRVRRTSRDVKEAERSRRLVWVSAGRHSSLASDCVKLIALEVINNKYECTIDQELRSKLLAGSRMRVMHTHAHSSWKHDVKSKIWLVIRQSMHIYLKNNRAKYHPDLLWNNGTLDVFEERRPNKKKNNNKI